MRHVAANATRQIALSPCAQSVRRPTSPRRTMGGEWAKTPEAVFAAHGTDPTKGLTSAKVTKLREEFGPNELDKEEGTPLWKLVLQQFDDLLVKILLGAASLSFVRLAPASASRAHCARPAPTHTPPPRRATHLEHRCGDGRA